LEQPVSTHENITVAIDAQIRLPVATAQLARFEDECVTTTSLGRFSFQHRMVPCFWY